MKRSLIPTVPILQMGKRRCVLVKVTQEITVWRRDKSTGVWHHVLIFIRGWLLFWVYEYAKYIWSWGHCRQEHIALPLSTNSSPLALWFVENQLQVWCLSFIHIGTGECSRNNTALGALLAIFLLSPWGIYVTSSNFGFFTGKTFNDSSFLQSKS